MLHLTRFPFSLLLQLPLAPIPRSVHFPLQGEGSACAHPLFERVLEPCPSDYRLCQTVTDELASQSVTASLRLPISDPEAKHYYYELGAALQASPHCSHGHRCWEPPAGPEAYLRRMELRTVSNHPLKAVWEDNLALRIHDIFESKGVK